MSSTPTVDPTLVRPLDELRAADSPIAGGKAANLGELISGGFAVPSGFVLTTRAYELAAEAAGVDPGDPGGASRRLLTYEWPDFVEASVRISYRDFGEGPVAVRSSATAEDLPGASFAGQQDTYLDIVGEDAVIRAVRHCWASLWNERAVAYRHANAIDDRGVAMAVVVQAMVHAAAAGVMFTADPITGRRHRSVIDAAHGLGDAVVSGKVDPDHYVADTASREVLERDVKGDQAVLNHAQVRELVELGDKIERHLGSAQDIEFAIDQDGKVWVVQSRAITTLYPLPAVLPDAATDLRVLFSGNVFQGYFEPITPMGLEVFRILGETIESAFTRNKRLPGGRSASDFRLVVDAGMRVYLDVTPILRNPLGRVAIERFTALGEARSSVVLHRLAADPRLAGRAGSRVSSLVRFLRVALRSGIPVSVLRTLLAPDRTRDRMLREIRERTSFELPVDATGLDRLEMFERLMRTIPPVIAPRVLPLVGAGMFAFVAAGRLLGNRARPDELQTVTRGLPHNPTTEMDMALWSIARDARRDEVSRVALLTHAPSDLAAGYQAGTLPPGLQAGLSDFLTQYGFRSVGEIDLGVKRWSEDPAHLLGALGNYVRLDNDARAPDAQFARGAREAQEMAKALSTRVNGPRRLLVRFFLHRVRTLMGAREQPKFNLIRRLFTPLRELLKPVGEELAASGRIESPDDIFFLTVDEARQALGGEDMRAAVATRRAAYERERARKHIPRVLLSDGTDAEVALTSAPDGALRGTPASPGSVTGRARVIMSPRGARLEPGEILVAPSTDPGWTPLFLTAGGLVMEMGGMMSHGAVVAREYGIPAVVGVSGATEQIASGQRLTVDGSAGVISLADSPILAPDGS
jgi:phosphohistidine swiveling domain-containing protein